MSVPHLTIDERRFVCAHYDRTVETVLVQCVKCGTTRKTNYPHTAPDAEIARTCFPGWKIKGVNRARSTVCPACLR